ncbi:hypothetical protein C4N9_20465 [Pararhodobacter marinus]|uniref:Uncharacterized protein n=1 Tax=Pararhodobacter marinus TaxID=2184063 RepID=A0A2U2C455_9RHOB|nr:hypothetical protein [Pararhodobacter marinus]PWE26642.1 hypothetical protein C4N9_20465 [Pararhodobacter marinus]
MALSFPLALDAFFGGLPVRTSTFHLPATLAVSRTRGGAVKTARVAERLWQGQITLPLMRHAQAAQVAALVSVLCEPGRTFLVHPRPLFAPIIDPSGAALDGYVPTIESIEDGGREFRIEGLPPGYVISGGDFLSFVYGSNPTRFALHQAVTVATADGAGLTPKIEVTPPIRPGAAIGAAVTLVRPFTKAVLFPPIAPISQILTTSGLTLDFVQTLG